jgi:hypothetical protein
VKSLSRDDIVQAFGIMGTYLAARNTLGEIALYGGGAIMLRFEWRKSSQDVDAVVISEGNHGLIRAAADHAAREMKLERSWFSENVSVYASTVETAADFSLTGMYPANGRPGLRVIAARPDYLLAMKLAALRRTTVDDRDLKDAGRLAAAIGLSTAEDLKALHARFFPKDELPPIVLLRLPELVRLITESR